MPLLERFQQTLQQVRLAPGACVVAAVSGGADSLCLLHLLWRLRADLGLTLHVAHLDHRLRGAESAADADFVRERAADWQIPATVEARDVAAYARHHRLGKQAAARAVRYAFLAQVAQALHADAVAVAHNADDQAETLLLHLLRGAGPAGLRAMLPLVPWQHWAPTAGRETGRPFLIRPLLDVPRAEIEAYCAAHGLVPRVDPTNSARADLRSRIRYDLLPILTTYNSKVAAALRRSARISGDDYGFMQRQLDDLWPRLAAVSPGAVRFERALFAELHPALRRYALRRAVDLLRGPSGRLDFEQIEHACVAAMGAVGTRLSLPGDLWLSVTHSATALSLGDLTAGHEVPQLMVDQVELPAMGQVALPGTPWSLRIGASPPHEPGRWAVCLDGERLAEPLYLRRRQPGDRLRPLGGQGSRRLQDLFVDRKLPREQRAGWPLLVNNTSLIWVVGLTVDERFAATETTPKHVWVELYRTA